MTRATSILFVILFLTTAGVQAGTGPEPPVLECPAPEPRLDGPPDGDWGQSGTTLLRREAPNRQTLITTIDPPTTGHYEFHVLPGNVPYFYVHTWPTERPMHTTGFWFEDDAGVRTLVPYLVTENLPDGAAGTTLLADLMSETTAAGEMQRMLAHLLLVSAQDEDGYSTPDLFSDRDPIYLWTTLRRVDDVTLWSGLVRTHEGEQQTIETETHERFDACRRVLLGAVTRDGTDTTFQGGASLVHEVHHIDPKVAYTTNETSRSQSNQYRTGAVVAETEVPLMVVHAEEGYGGPTYGYANESRHEASVGLWIEDEHVPLLGVQSEVQHADPPEAQNRMLSIGVYDRHGDYHPQAGLRTHVERFRFEEWIGQWVETGTFGSQEVGDWEQDLGVFDPWGRFVPIVGSAYDDGLGGVHREDVPTGITTRYGSGHQAMVTAGAFVDRAYLPLIGQTYDGDQPLLEWANDLLQGTASDRWLVSAGAFAPLGRYVPLVGASARDGLEADGSYRERYRVGGFVADYASWRPLVGSDWTSDRPSAKWARDSGLQQRAAADGQIDFGYVDPVTNGFMPVTTYSVAREDADHHRVGIWAAGGHFPLIEACARHWSTDWVVGVSVADGSGDVTPVAALRPGDPPVRPMESCGG